MNALDLHALLGECIGQESGLRDDLRERLSIARRSLRVLPDSTIPRVLIEHVRKKSTSWQEAQRRTLLVTVCMRCHRECARCWIVWTGEPTRDIVMPCAERERAEKGN